MWAMRTGRNFCGGPPPFEKLGRKKESVDPRGSDPCFPPRTSTAAHFARAMAGSKQ